MKILFVGGSGGISSACVRHAIARGHQVTILTRGQRALVGGAEHIAADVNNASAAAAAIGARRFDAVADFTVFSPAEMENRIALFRGRTGQYIFISTASAYQKPGTHWLTTESTPLVNPYWDYSRNKIACEERLLKAYRDETFPATIVRPSWTYGDTVIPLAFNAWPKTFTSVARMRRGEAVIVPGDGLTLWTMTHNSDFAKGFVGLFGHHGAIGHAFHITSDEPLTWNQLYHAVAEAAGAPAPKLAHIASDFIGACMPPAVCGLLGDKANCAVFDNSKIKQFVPEFSCSTRFREGIAQTLAWFDGDKARQQIDDAWNAECDKLIATYERGLQAARKDFGM